MADQSEHSNTANATDSADKKPEETTSETPDEDFAEAASKDSSSETESTPGQTDTGDHKAQEDNEEGKKRSSHRQKIEETPYKRSVIFTIFGILFLISALVQIPSTVISIFTIISVFSTGQMSNQTAVTQIISIVSVVSLTMTIIGFILLGIRLIRNKRHRAHNIAELLIVLLIIDLLCSLMLSGVTTDLLVFLIVTVIVIVLMVYIDPELSKERRAERRLHREQRNEKMRAEAETHTLGRDKSGKGYIKLDFFNLFWIFVIACFLGDMFETIWHMVVVDPGVYQDRAGLLWGPFSPIYGIGAILMTLALNRFYKKNIIIIFLISAVIGGAFEYFVSWFLQFAFGITAWDYTGTFLSIGGRTNFFFMCMWGILGVFWIKLMLPLMLRLVNLIPWKWRYIVTAVCAAFMIVNATMTLMAYDCWYSRMAGLPSDSPIMQFFGQYFDNDWMANRFQTMTIDPSSTTRTN